MLRIRFILIRIRILFRIRPEIEKKKTFFITFFLLITQKMIYFYMNIENLVQNEKNYVFFMYLR